MSTSCPYILCMLHHCLLPLYLYSALISLEVGICYLSVAVFLKNLQMISFIQTPFIVKLLPHWQRLDGSIFKYSLLGFVCFFKRLKNWNLVGVIFISFFIKAHLKKYVQPNFLIFKLFSSNLLIVYVCTK